MASAEERAGPWLTPGVTGIGAASFLADAGHEVPTALLPNAVLLAHVRRAGRPRGAHRLLIAATATARGRLVVTHDAGGFAGLPGVEVRPSG